MTTKKGSTPGDKKEKTEQHNKSIHASSEKAKTKSAKDPNKNSKKNIQKTGTKDDDWNDPTGNSHLSDES